MPKNLLWTNTFSYLVLMGVNILAIQLPFFGKTPGDVSDLFPNLLTPADFSFKIWSLIYILLAFFIWHQVQTIRRNAVQDIREVEAISYLFLATCILNFSWLLLWQSMHLTWSFISIFLLWAILIIINYRLTKLKKSRWFYTLPFSFYLAWVCVAALANLNVLLIDIDFSFFNMSEEIWTASLIGIGICGTLLVIYLNQDIWFTVVLIWAFLGMYVKNKEISEGGNWVTSMSLFAMIFLGSICLFLIYKKWISPNMKSSV